MDCESQKHTPAMWYPYHAARSHTVIHIGNLIETLLPLSHEKATTPEIIRHGMKLLKNTTEHLISYQNPVVVVGQPLYDIPKMQWIFTGILGDDKFEASL